MREDSQPASSSGLSQKHRAPTKAADRFGVPRSTAGFARATCLGGEVSEGGLRPRPSVLSGRLRLAGPNEAHLHVVQDFLEKPALLLRSIAVGLVPQ
jgi:hypothetical protein